MGMPTLKQKLFVENYIHNGFNATQAALKAGYSKKTAYSIGNENLNKPEVKKLLKKRIEAILSDTQLLTIKWLQQVQNIAFFDLRKAVEWDASGVRLKSSNIIDDNTAAAIQEVSEVETLNGGSIKIKANDKNKALELIGKYLAILNDNPPDAEKFETASELSAAQRRERIIELQRKLNG